MAGFPPPNMPGGPGGAPGTQMGPPPSMPGVTQPPGGAPPQALAAQMMKRPEQAGQLIRQAVLMLQQAADMDPRLEDRIGAAVKLLRGPSKPDTTY